MLRIWLLSISFILLMVQPIHAQQLLPQLAPDMHLGNITCGNSNCHAASQPWVNSAVLQNEYTYFLANDPHAKSYQTLEGKKAQDIAAKLKIGDPRKASICLDCHANNVPESKQAKTFNIADGVSCESCHGPSSRWLGQHVSLANFHSENITAGMYPTEDPSARAELCASCHIGNEKKFINHELYGAGHPRTPFELNAYSQSYAHFITNEKYARRKFVMQESQAWALGQVVTLRKQMQGIADPARFVGSLTPELAYFDCYSCHRNISGGSLKGYQHLTVPVPQINSVNAIMTGILFESIDPPSAATLMKQFKVLQDAPLQSYIATHLAAKNVLVTLSPLEKKVAQKDFVIKDLPALTQLIAKKISQLDEITPTLGEQTYFALFSQVRTIEKLGSLSPGQVVQMQKQLTLLRQIIDEKNFNEDQFRRTLQQLVK
jgi:hypothetical protein